MTNEELNIKVAHLAEKIKYPPERNRTCVVCNKPFYANNLRKFCCSVKCYQTNYNERERPLKQIEKLYSEIKAEQDAMDEFKHSLQTTENILRRNIEIIDHLTIDPLVGTEFEEDILSKLGMNFEVYDYREMIPNRRNAFQLIMGSYRISLMNDQTIKIQNNKKL
jgi:hypothetical protein